jgi:hypothetical protein
VTVMRAEYETVFVKDMAYYLVNRLDTPAYLPDNYVHAFLLRDPHKSVYSLYKMSLNKDLTGRLLSYGRDTNALGGTRKRANKDERRRLAVFITVLISSPRMTDEWVELTA